MSISKIKKFVISFYLSSDKPTFLFACVALWQLIAFLPSLPSIAVYGVYIAYAFYILLKSSHVIVCRPLLAFLLFIPIQLLIIAPDSSFHCWDRYVLFVLLLINVSPLLYNPQLAENRNVIFRIAMGACTFLGVGSFFARYLGINYATTSTLENILAVGTFGGLTHHSMLLAPVASIGFVFCCWMGYIRNKWIYWCLGGLCIIAVMFSGSRSALMGAIAAITILLYKLTGTKAKFMKVAVSTVLVASVSFPVWGSALEPVMQKYEGNVVEGSAYSSREHLWRARLMEFESSPLIGVGFDAIDIKLSLKAGGYDKVSGMVESGSSWLIILSMTGVIGAILLFPFFWGTYRLLWLKPSPLGAMLLGLLTFFFVHMIAEGYIFYGGSMLAFLFWLTIGVSRDYLQYSEKTDEILQLTNAENTES